MTMERKHYGAIDGLRAIACIGIVMMHVSANSGYNISGFAYDRVIASFTNFVFLFMTISAFGMCCGYYYSMLENKVNLTDFYSKRFMKILPFFSILVLFDVVMSPSLDALYEAFADLTLLFRFLQNSGNITVIGVGWFLGLIFVFYTCFPFFCVLLSNKRRAWLSFIISLIWNFACSSYFNVGRSNILYSSCYFFAGGLVYLYRGEISKVNRWVAIVLTATSVVLYYAIGANTVTMLLISILLLSYAVICAGGGYHTEEYRIGQSDYSLYKSYQYGDLPFPHGYIPCD